MKKTKKKLSEYWDNLILKTIHPHANFQKIEGEIKEHFSFMQLVIKRILLPIILLYILLGLIFEINIFGTLFICMIIFLYSNFLPDLDLIVKNTNKKSQESLWYEKYFALFFAPIIIYYILIGRAKPIYSTEKRCFHNIKSMIVWGIFLLILGNILWDENIKISMLIIFGTAGFLFHIIVDGVVKGSNLIKEKLSNKKS